MDTVQTVGLLIIFAMIFMFFIRPYMFDSKKSSSNVSETSPSSEKIHPIDKINDSYNATRILFKSGFAYKGATIQYKVKVENPTSDPIGDVNVNLYVPDVFISSESNKSIPLIKPSESKSVTFDIRPTGECGNCQVSGKVIYYDYKTKETTEATIPPKNVSIVCLMLKSKEIDETEWRNTLAHLTKAEENTKDIDIPATTLFDITSDVLRDMNLFMLDPKVNDSENLYRAVSKFYGEGVKSLRYAAQIEIVGGPSKSKMILKAWAESEDALTGFYHGILDEIDKRVHVKNLINTNVVNNYHYGDNIGTQISDSVVQRSFNQNNGNQNESISQENSSPKVDEQVRGKNSDDDNTKAPNSNDFKNGILSELTDAENEGKNYLDIKAGDLHRAVGGYPQPYNRMPICCSVMRQLMLKGDEIIEQPPKGNGANLLIRYHLPRE